jgi:sterol desaturase/sphingolipid hydroxylase (fatty acid hydroxylase superfamily)
VAVAQFLHTAGEVLAAWLVFLAIHLSIYVGSTAVVVLSFRLFWNRGLSACKVQEREASAADIRREIRSSLGTVLIFSAIYAGVYFGARAHIFTVYMGIAPLGWGYLVLSVAAMTIAHDAYFYWTHRLLHLRAFARFHLTHHQSITPTAYSCYAFQPAESTLHGLFQPLFLMVFPMQVPGLVIAIGFMMVRNILGHSGVELFARQKERSKWFGWLVTTRDHDLHHSSYHCNFGFHFTWWDRLMGTEHPGAEALRTSRWFGGEARARLPMATAAIDAGGGSVAVEIAGSPRQMRRAPQPQSL